jgi:hypothetical protein
MRLLEAPGRGALLALAAFVVLAAVVSAGLVAVTRGGTPTERLPDLVQRAPYQLVGQTARGPRGERRFRIGFGSAVDNLGDGPLRIAARRRPGQPTMVADQVVERSDGSTTRVARVGTLRYTRSETHQHWHLLRFDRYSLLDAGGARTLRRDRKTGFCLGDRYDARPTERLPGDPGRPVLTGECGRGRPGLRSIQQGISVGYGDDYDPILEGQYLDVTRLPAGRYELLHRANTDRRVRETDYENNAASILIELRWPRGLGRPPAIEVVERCGDGRRCTRR